MTGAEFAERLVHEGLSPAEGDAKTRLYGVALEGLSAAGARRPSHAWWVPGRLELFGKHTDYAGGHSLVAAVPRGFVFLTAPRSDEQIVVIDGGNGQQVSIGGGQDVLSGWRRYVAVVAARLSRNFPGAGGGLSIAFASDLPRASGMSSSSALVVGIAAALIERWELASRSEWQRDIHDRCDLASYLACVENGSSFRGLTGDAGVGTHGGSEDHAAMLLARAGSLSAYVFAPVRHVRDVALPPGWTVVIASSGVSAEKTGAAQGGYNRLADGVETLLRLWNGHEAPAASLAAALASDASACGRLKGLVQRSQIPGWPADALLRRLDHFVSEDSSVQAAIAAIESSDPVAIGEISAASQRNAEDLLRQQVPETIALAAEARSCGAFAACSFGAGFGGSVWALVDRDRAPAFADDWLAAYRRRYPESNAVAFVAPPGPPLLALRGSH